MSFLKAIRRFFIGTAAYNEHTCLRCGSTDFNRLKIAGDEAIKELKHEISK